MLNNYGSSRRETQESIKAPENKRHMLLGDLIVQKVNLQAKKDCYKNVVHNAYATQNRGQLTRPNQSDLFRISNNSMQAAELFKNKAINEQNIKKY